MKLHPKDNIVILTGAGISAESGLSTFRDEDGLWCQHRIEDVATPEAYAANPALVQEFYNKRRAQLKEVEPNDAHKALARLEQEWQGDVCIVTQNVDDLHERAGSKNLIHMHGVLTKVRCTNTETIYDWHEDIILDQTQCDCCKQTNTLRPHIVWFGEIPMDMDVISHKLAHAGLFISIGTSGNVYPAAGFVYEAKTIHNAATLELNLEPSGSPYFDDGNYGPATEVIPQFVNDLLEL